MEEVRLQKFMADVGVASRRKCEEFILAGLVSVNGKAMSELGTKVDPESDKVEFRGKELRLVDNRITVMLNKPRGYVCTTATDEGPSVYGLLRTVGTRVVSVGRLDRDTEGLLLFSNDGDLVNRLTHPSFDTEKVYEAFVRGSLNPDQLKKLNSRMVLDGYLIRRVRVKVLKKGRNGTLLEFRLKEGRNRQIRKMCKEVGLEIETLKRKSMGGLELGSLEKGKWKKLSEKELDLL